MGGEDADRDKSPALLVLKDVHRHYQRGPHTVRALDGVSLEVKQGEFWAVMGVSGSGKSSLLNLLGCLDRPTAGDYYLDGHNVAHLDDDAMSEVRLRKLGFVFQDFHLIPQLSVQENIALPLFYQGVDSHECARRARGLGEQVGLGDRLDHRPSELSGGQCQRAAIARALSNEPTIILADEPTGNLDSATSLQIMELIAGLSEQGRTIIMVTHETYVAEYASHRLILRDGRVQEAGRKAATP